MKQNKCYIKSFSGTKAKDMESYIIPSLTEQKTDVPVTHIGGNDINYKNLENSNVNELTHIIINFGRKCSEYGVSYISGILAKRNLQTSAVIKKVNDKLDDLCEPFDFHFISSY